MNTPSNPKRDSLDEAHFRIDELVRENQELRRMVSVEHIAGVAHGAAADYADRLKVGNSALISKMDALIATMQTLLGSTTVRTGTINLPSGPVTMEVHERLTAPWKRQ